jgi:hypothetical protein
VIADSGQQLRVADAELERHGAVAVAMAIARLDETGERLIGGCNRTPARLLENGSEPLPVGLVKRGPDGVVECEVATRDPRRSVAQANDRSDRNGGWT